MTLNRNKPPLNFRSRWHTEGYIYLFHKITCYFPEWPWIATSHRWNSDPKGIPKNTKFVSNNLILISRMTLNRNKPPLNFRSCWHTEIYILFFIQSHFNFQNDLETQQATVEFQIPLAYRRMHIFVWKSHLNFKNDLETQQATVEF